MGMRVLHFNNMCLPMPTSKIKYKGIYNALEKLRKQRIEQYPTANVNVSSHLEMKDFSGWWQVHQSFATKGRPLWIIVHDKHLKITLWITHEHNKLEITLRENAEEKTSWREFEKQGDMIIWLERFFDVA